MSTPSSLGSKPVSLGPMRLMSLDAYRGFIMLAMASGGLGVAAVAPNFPNSEAWQSVAFQLEHVPWVGCSFWDLIQPSFMFMVGVAMAWSYGNRQARGQSYRRMLGHAVIRSGALILLGLFLMSNGEMRTEFNFVNVLTQIGLGYTGLFLLWNRGAVVQVVAAVMILAGYWYLFYEHPIPPGKAPLPAARETAEFEPLAGLEAHWNKDTNAAADFDRWFLNLFPREQPFVSNEGGYQTLNFVPSLATMIFGLLAGGWLRGSQGGLAKLFGLLAGGVLLVGVGYWIQDQGWCPLVKRIWTPSWAVFSAGLAMLILAAFYGVIDLAGFRWPAWPLVVVGMNSIVVYCLDQLVGGQHGWIARSLQTHLGPGVFQLWGLIDPLHAPIVGESLVLVCLWLVCAWLYKQRLFVRI